MIYEFYSIGPASQGAHSPASQGAHSPASQDPLRSGGPAPESKTQEKQIVYIGHTNSFSMGLHRFMSSVVDKVPPPVQHMELDLIVKGNTQTPKDGECILIFVRAKEHLFSAAVRAVDNVRTRGVDCKAQLMNLYGVERPALTL